MSVIIIIIIIIINDTNIDSDNKHRLHELTSSVADDVAPCNAVQLLRFVPRQLDVV